MSVLSVDKIPSHLKFNFQVVELEPQGQESSPNFLSDNQRI